MKAKTIRKINATAFAVAAIVIAAGVAKEWLKADVCAFGLFVCVSWYVGIIAVLWLVVDVTIKEANENG